MSDTPRTDKAAGFILESTPELPQGFARDPDGSYVSADFARELARENASLRKALGDLLEFSEDPFNCTDEHWLRWNEAKTKAESLLNP